MDFGIDLESGSFAKAGTDVIDEAIAKVTIASRKQVLNGVISDRVLFLLRLNAAYTDIRFQADR
jgi:hypothetical protein